MKTDFFFKKSGNTGNIVTDIWLSVFWINFVTFKHWFDFWTFQLIRKDTIFEWLVQDVCQRLRNKLCYSAHSLTKSSAKCSQPISFIFQVYYGLFDIVCSNRFGVKLDTLVTCTFLKYFFNLGTKGTNYKLSQILLNLSLTWLLISFVMCKNFRPMLNIKNYTCIYLTVPN